VDQAVDPITKKILIVIAAAYQQLASLAEAKLVLKK